MINPRPDGAVYQQLAAVLRRDITAGRLRPGQRLPSETSMQQQYGVARNTVRRAVAVLRAEGLVKIHRGYGAIVREHQVVQDLVPAPGSTVSARMPTPQEIAEFDLEDGVPVFVVAGLGGPGEVFPADRWQLRWPAR